MKQLLPIRGTIIVQLVYTLISVPCANLKMPPWVTALVYFLNPSPPLIAVGVRQ
jgi:hypothetical protein